MTEKLIYPYIVRTEYVRDRIARPFVPVRIRYRHNEIQTMALVDSGADINVLPFQLGLNLGAGWHNREHIGGLEGAAGGGLEAKRFVADLYVGAWPSIRQIFAWTRDEDLPVILGQIDFFHRVDVCFHRSRNYLELDLSAG